ncbi:hypothetical protein CONPUDRAFT_127671 [Coniophora puteana RWD-64-598 SS2]|uniref:Uncharacterized protein n=1 Tax=Coniophora puteana (strain RWD-64-598) TaxID=741705 RepID=A0A5M3MGQ3_CONPW|nr:uncharacterized protein CONPUDRAFT_127671 [Coniophora puteana RWD-64-598 SS2]EIW78176.1 hypothetical protein CONPUDRAFT_127671 [Coniophora puteana RWD-64-598 SS2]
MALPNGISLDAAAIVSTVLEGILYVFSLLLFLWTVHTVLRRNNTTRVITSKIIIAAALLVLSTAHLAVNVVRTIEGLVLYRDKYPGGTAVFFEDVTEWSFGVKMALYLLQTLLGDGIVIIRCYIAWHSWKIVSMPIFLWFALVLTGASCIFSLVHDPETTRTVFAAETAAWISRFLASTLLANLFATALLVYRLWTNASAADPLMGWRPATAPLLRIIADAGLLYSATLVAVLLCYVTKNTGYYVLMDMAVPIISITFYMVIIRVSTRKGPASITKSELATFVRPRDRCTSKSGSCPSSPISPSSGERHSDVEEVVSFEEPVYPIKTLQRAASTDEASA